MKNYEKYENEIRKYNGDEFCVDAEKTCGDCECKIKELDCAFNWTLYCTNLNSAFCGMPVFNDNEACEDFVEKIKEEE